MTRSLHFWFPICLLSLPAAAAPQDPGWLQGVQREIRQAEYAFAQRPDGAWSSPNRAQDLRVRIVDGAVEVFPRSTTWEGSGAAWKLRLSTASFGRLSDPRPLSPPELSVQGNRATLKRAGFEEWFQNDERGLEQGWTIHARPTSIGDDPLWIGLEIQSELAFRIAADALSATLDAPDGKTVMRYAGLRAWDAEGRPIEARMIFGPDGPGIRVIDTGAAYPLTVDPILTGPTWTTESDQDSARFGWSLGAAGDVNGDGYTDQIVGAIWYDDGEMNEGRVFVFDGSASGPATTASWIADGNAIFAELGWSVSTAGDVNGDGYSDVIVGAPNFANGEAEEGAAYVYLGSSTGLAATPVWSYESDQAGAKLGAAVGAAGDVNGDGFSDIVVGAPRIDDTLVDEGQALVFLGAGGGPSTTPDWTVSGGVAGAQLGFSVYTSGDVDADGFDDLLVGADLYADGEMDEGAAFLFMGSGTGLATTAAWSIEGDQVGAEYGASVRTAGDVNADGFADALVGAPGFSNGQAGEGRSLLFLGSGAGLSATAAWTFEGNNAGARLGTSVSTAGDLNADGFSDVVIGAPNFALGQADEGAVIAFLGEATGLPGAQFFTMQGNQVGAMLGFSVSTAGDANGDGYADLLFGAWGWDNGETDEGRAFLHLGSAEDTPDEAFNTKSNQDDAHLGTSVAGAGDVNGDGFSDVLVGAPDFDNGEADEGSAFLFLGSATGLSATADWTAEGDLAGISFGAALDGAGDVNNDGYDDVIIGAPNFEGIVNEQGGQARLYLGSTTGLSTTADWATYGGAGTTGAMYGAAVAGAGDMDGDGLADVLVGAPNFGAGDEGRAWLFKGTAGGLAALASWTVAGTQAGENLGLSLAGAGDVNGDGFSDLLIGSPFFANGQNNEGTALVFHGGKGVPSTTPDWSAESNQVGAGFGFDVASAGDVNGDGFSDVIVGASSFDGAFTNEGRAFLYLGSGSGLSPTPTWIANGGQNNALLGVAVGGVGDVNGDGYGDLLVGSPFRDIGQMDEGQVFFYLGAASGPSLIPTWNFEGNQTGAQFGRALDGLGDVNGDGYADFAVGAPFFSLGFNDEGAMLLFHGNDDKGGLVSGIQQLRTDLSAPVALLGRSNAKDMFGIRTVLPEGVAPVSWAAPGATTAWLEWEIKALDAPFDGTGLERSAVGQSVIPANLPLTFEEVVQRPAASLLPDKWRARVVTDNPLFPATPWFALPGNSPTEAKISFSNSKPKFYILKNSPVQKP